MRVAESRFGYSLSHFVSAGKVKHYMIDQTPDGQYIDVGNARRFDSLNALVGWHRTHNVIAPDPHARARLRPGCWPQRSRYPRLVLSA